jgi:fatty acid desaturase
LHLAGTLPVLGFVVWAGVPVWQYVAAAYLGMSVLMIRTFIEHRACETTPQRTAVVEAGVLMRLLFLNNNYHAVHHNHANLAWYKLPALWRAERARTLDGNGHYHYPQGYLAGCAALAGAPARARRPSLHAPRAARAPGP